MHVPASDDLADAGWQVPRCETLVLRPRSARYAVVIPVWNEGAKLARQLTRMASYLDLVDVVIADAPSTDGSTAPARLGDLGVHALILLREPGGQSSSLRTGLAYAMRSGFAGVIEMDGNDKDDPEAIPRFIAELDAGVDYVQGSRYAPGGRGRNTPWDRELLIRFVHAPLFSLICRRRFTDTTNGFRAYSRALLATKTRPFRDAFKDYELVYYLAWAACRGGHPVAEVPVTRAYPLHGGTPTKIRSLRRYLDMLKPIAMLALERY